MHGIFAEEAKSMRKQSKQQCADQNYPHTFILFHPH